MFNYNAFRPLSPTTLADALSRDHVMDIGIRPLWGGIPRVAGPAYTVECAPGDNLMLHAAIYRAAPGSIIVVKAGGMDYAVSGGNVCRVAQRRGIAAFVVDGVVRDVAEARKNGFPIFARGIIPIPGGKEIVMELNQPVQCGGVRVEPGDCVVGDEEGIVAEAGRDTGKGANAGGKRGRRNIGRMGSRASGTNRVYSAGQRVQKLKEKAYKITCISTQSSHWPWRKPTSRWVPRIS